MTAKLLLTTGALLSFIIALMHVVMIFIGAEAYRYFDAGQEMVDGALSGSMRPTIVTLGVTAFLTLFGVYALSGAGWIKSLPLLKPALWLIGGIYTLRGLGLFAQIGMLAMGQSGDHLAPKDLVFSLVSLLIGIIYLLGTWKHTTPTT
jgi:putative oxidoreductase